MPPVGPPVSPPDGGGLWKSSGEMNSPAGNYEIKELRPLYNPREVPIDNTCPKAYNLYIMKTGSAVHRRPAM